MNHDHKIESLERDLSRCRQSLQRFLLESRILAVMLIVEMLLTVALLAITAMCYGKM